jgi:beta propeller repeat protein
MIPPVPSQVCGSEVQLTTSAADQLDPAISGDIVVYTDARNLDMDIYAYNISSGVELQITSGGGDQMLSDVSGNLVVYTDFGMGNADVCVFNLTSLQTVRLANSSANQRKPTVSGTRVVYEDDRNVDWDIYMTSLVTMVETRLTGSPANQRNPVIQGPYVVWEDYRAGNADVHLLNLKEMEETAVTNWTSQETDPTVEGDIVSFFSSNFSVGDVFYYQISTGETVAVTAGPDFERNPVVSGDRVTYESYADGNAHVWLYSVSLGLGHQLTTALANQYLHDTSGNRTVYTDDRNGNLDIYMFTVTCFSRDVELAYDDDSGETWVAIQSDQFLRQRFNLSDFALYGEFVVTDVRVYWAGASGDFAGTIRLREYDIGDPVLAANFSSPTAGWQDYDVYGLRFVSDHFFVEIWRTTGFGYVYADTDPPCCYRSEKSGDQGESWFLIQPDMDFLIRVVVTRPVHDVATDGVLPSKTVVGQGYLAKFNVTAQNQGNLTETFTLTLKANGTAIETKNVTLLYGSSFTVTFNWNNGNFSRGRYVVTATVNPVEGEMDTADNTITYASVTLTIPGDVDGDRDVDIFDIVSMAGLYGDTVPPAWPLPPQDIDGDGDIDIFDIVIAAGNYGESW